MKYADVIIDISHERLDKTFEYIVPDELEEINKRLQKVYDRMAEKEVLYEKYLCDDAEIIITAYGSVGRIAKSAVDILRAEGKKVGLFRPITLCPLPTKELKALANQASVKEFVVTELSMGQYIDDVRLATDDIKPIRFYCRTGGNVMSPEDIVAFIKGEN